MLVGLHCNVKIFRFALVTYETTVDLYNEGTAQCFYDLELSCFVFFILWHSFECNDFIAIFHTSSKYLAESSAPNQILKHKVSLLEFFFLLAGVQSSCILRTIFAKWISIMYTECF